MTKPLTPKPCLNSTLSLPARLLFYLGPPSTVLLTSYISPKAGLLSPMAFAPTAYFYQKWRSQAKTTPDSNASLEPLVWTFGTMATLGLSSVALIQMAIMRPFSRLLFYKISALEEDFWTEFARSSITGLSSPELARRAELAASWRNWVFMAVLSFAAAGAAEEVLKFVPVLYARRKWTPEERKQKTRGYLDYAMAGALAFGCIETIGFLYAATQDSSATPLGLLVTVFERVVIGQTGHMAAAALSALRATRKDCYGEDMSWWSVIAPSIAFHGAYDFLAFSCSALEGNVGWIHPTSVGVTSLLIGGISGMVGTLLWMVKGQLKRLGEADVKKENDAKGE